MVGYCVECGAMLAGSPCCPDCGTDISERLYGDATEFEAPAREEDPATPASDIRERRYDPATVSAFSFGILTAVVGLLVLDMLWTVEFLFP